PHSHTREQPFACGSGGNSFCDKAGVTRYEEITHVGRRADQLSPAPCVRRVVPTNCTSGHGPQEVLQVPAPPGCCGETDRQGASFQDAPAAQSSVGACSSRPADNKQNAEEDETSTPPKLIHTFLCDDCDYTTRNENFLIRHRRAHVETNSLLQCHVCNEEFPQLALLEAHTPSHLTARPYMCDVCGARFQNLTNVKDHVRKHTRERPFACKVCGRTFVYRSSWISHAKTHPEQRPFACHLCPETFLLKRSLKDHYMKQHTNKQ
ncbi:zinc finger protein, putative, partial [Ixodes scapularis]